MSNFQNIVLPDFLSSYIIGGPRFDTSVVQSISGREARYSNLNYAFQKYFIKNCKLSIEEFEEFNCFFRNCKGAALGFYLKDYSDYQVRGQAFQAAEQSSFELFKYYKFEDKFYARRIYKPVSGTLRVSAGGNEIAADLDCDRGIVTIHSLENEALTIDFDFYVPVRFINDHFNYSLSKDGSIALEDIELTEICL